MTFTTHTVVPAVKMTGSNEKTMRKKSIVLKRKTVNNEIRKYNTYGCRPSAWR